MDILHHIIPILFLWNSLSVSADCPSPFALAEGLCLYVSSHTGTGLKTWAAARAHCQSIGGDLLISPPDTQRLKRFLRTYTSDRRINKGICTRIPCRTVDRWIGASRDASGDWQWLSGSTALPQRIFLTQHRTWPACLILATWDGSYKDSTCEQRKAYLCQPKEEVRAASSAQTAPNPTVSVISAAPVAPIAVAAPVVPVAPVAPVPILTTVANPLVIATGNGQVTNTTPVSCGRSTRSDERIINGRPTIAGLYPWMVHLSYFSSFHDTIIPCGGTLVSKKWILTAAHCFNFLKPNIDVIVKVGFVDRTRQDPGSSVFVITQNSIITHDEFSATTLENDIALARLPGEVILSDVIQTICLGTNQHIPFGGKAFAAGWGLLSPTDSKGPATLHDVQLDVLPDASCKSPQHFICAFTPGSDTCSGDSGGPLMVEHSGQWYQVGIVSHGPPDCGNHPAPGIYTRVPNYTPWLTSNIKL